MPVLADPVVLVKLSEFREYVDALTKAKYLADGDRIMVIRELCELSRNATFDLGPLRFADPNQALEVANCFQESADALLAMWAGRTIPDDATRYCENIRRRARRCLGEE